MTRRAGWQALCFVLRTLWARETASSRHRRWLVTATFAAVLMLSLRLVAPWVLGLAVDALAGARPGTLAMPLAMGYVLLWSGAAIGERGKDLLIQRVMEDLRRRTGLGYLTRLIELPAHRAREVNAGQVLDCLFRVEVALPVIVTGLVFGLLPLAVQVVATGVILMLNFGVLYGVILGATVLAYVLTLRPSLARVTRRESQANDVSRATTGALADTLSQLECVKTFAQEPAEVGRLAQRLRTRYEAALATATTAQLTSALQMAIMAAGVSAMTLLAVSDVSRGAEPVGTLVQVNAYLLQFALPAAMLGALVSQVARALVSVDEHLRDAVSVRFAEDPQRGATGRCAAALVDGDRRDRSNRGNEGDLGNLGNQYAEDNKRCEQTSAAQRPFASAAPCIELDGVSVTTSDARAIVSDVRLRIGAGEYVALVGPSGAGKSTLLRLIAGMVLPSRGAVYVDARPLCRDQADAMRRVTGFVTQDGRLFDRPLFDNVAYRAGLGAEVPREDGPVQAEFLRVTALAEVPHTASVAGLSGGERQRVNIARALWGRPPLLLLDEPTAALDALTEARILDRLAGERAGATCVVVAHRLAAIRHADRIVVMDAGRIVETGDHVTLLRHGGLYARMWHAQQAEQVDSSSESRSPIADLV
ncbi:ABC transporter ATP-binding protein [Pandoraea anhela]|uniref:ATM1-type heavy metal exporter n=1 Tax=Pandoraea anhela TaxID=2508295 RepID=A0A5E4TJB6_9BURK|nr:ABC transporter ATP-binding protein [Pandoraea anhela]VVD87631.1 ATM1-type heavy metal exporter [Pandoraea anhela]